MASEEEILYSGIGAPGRQSRRSYTRSEVEAGKRQGLVIARYDGLGGPMFWATGDHYPGLVRQALADFQLLRSAIEREWGKEDPNATPTSDSGEDRIPDPGLTPEEAKALGRGVCEPGSSALGDGKMKLHAALEEAQNDG